jgi:tRNA(Ile)-lysidine synthase
VKPPVLVSAVDRALRLAGRPARGETLVVALSGGADSVALTDALASLAPRRGFRLVAAHLDHGLRADSADDASFCEALWARLGVPFVTGAADVRARAERERGGLEQAARRERYLFLRRAAREQQAGAIALAHTLDDQAETLLLRLLRGAGATGLGGMRALSRDLLRPLLGVSRAEVLAHLRERGLPWREDPTNRDPAHARNRVRHELLPYLEARFNPRARATLARAAALLADEAAQLQARARDVLRSAAAATDDGRVVLERAAIARCPPALGRAVLRLALHRAGGLAGVGAVHVERLRLLALRNDASGRRLSLPGGREACFEGGRLVLQNGRTRPG